MSSALRSLVEGVRGAQRHLAQASGDKRTAVLGRVASLLEERSGALLEANRRDLEGASDVSAVLRARLGLTEAKLQGLVDAVRQIAAMPDPLGRELRATALDQGLELRQVTSPIGVVLIIFESRPDAVIQIGSLIVRSGNGVIMKGGREATCSNRALIQCLRDALEDEGLSPDAVAGVEGREAVGELLEASDVIDLVIPRGSNELVRSIQQSTRIPVLGHADGICHVYLDSAASLEKAVPVVLDSKTGYPSACNAAETLLVHREFLSRLPSLGRKLVEAGVELRADEESRAIFEEHGVASVAAEADDFGQEFGELVLAVRVVDELDQAIAHIHRYGSGHTDAIVTEDGERAEAFLRQVDAASVFHNASTRFADGFRYGLGAEVGISTGRIHARGPVGVEGLLTSRWLLRGEGQAAGDYGPGKKAFLHTALS